MVRIITIDDIKNLIRKITLPVFMQKLIERLQLDYARWDEFDKMPRVATHVAPGVLELMPICDNDFYAFKFVNGHPNNPLANKLTVSAVGTLADVATGYPLLMSEMTLLTAIRTAATSALASKYLAQKSAKTFAMIGCGAQSEFQVLAHRQVFLLAKINYFDVDENAMKKFAHNLARQKFTLNACDSIERAIEGAEIITTATASKKHGKILHRKNIQPGVHVNGIGGDCPGKTELDEKILEDAKIVVEYFPQTKMEGEIQNFSRQEIYAELWELAAGKKAGRENNTEITLFDSVGFALEDYSVLRLVHALAEDFHIGHMMDMVPDLKNPKDLYGFL